MVSGEPQGSVIITLLFLVDIIDLPELVKHICKLFADYTKLISINNNFADQKMLQEVYTNCLVDWSRIWLMEFNEDKGKVIVKGWSKLGQTVITMERKSGDLVELKKTMYERDLGVVE